MKLVFASNSPRRKELLSKFDLDIAYCQHQFDEKSIKKDMDPKYYCKLIAQGKSKSILSNYEKTPILSADTIVLIKNRILEKPIDYDEAFNMLSMLSGDTHQVITAVNILYLEGSLNFTFIEETSVTFNKLDSNDISYYIRRHSPYDKAGGYGIQGFSSIFVKKIDGCYFNVVGLPLSSLFYHLKKFNLIEFPLNTLNKNDNLSS